MDKIVVNDLVIFANHGVFKEEKFLGQRFELDLELSLESQKSAISGDLSKSVNYGILCEEITSLFKSKSVDLIESLAEEIALFILKKYPIVKEVLVRLKKPWAPINLPLKTVYVEVKRSWHRVFLSLGSNMGDSEKTLRDAIDNIENEYVKLVNTSNMYTTKAWGKEDQADFKNMAIEIKTIYEKENLLEHTQKIEKDFGRERHEHWGPRTLDIDILFYDDEIFYSENLIIPHPYIEERQFVLDPMNDIASHFIHPVSKRSIRNLLNDLLGKNNK